MNIKAFNELLNSSYSAQNQYDEWSGYREAITSYIEEAMGDEVDTILILGAGNCNDIGLKHLIRRSKQLILTDIDGEAVRRGSMRQQVEVQIMGMDYLGIEGTKLMAGLSDLCAFFSEDRYNQWLESLVSTIKERRFTWSQAVPDIVVVMPIYTQLIFRQVEHQLNEAYKIKLITSKQLAFAQGQLLEEVPKVIQSFNLSLIEMAQQGSTLIVYSDYIEDSPMGPYCQGFKDKRFDVMFHQYHKTYGMGLGHYGMEDLAYTLKRYNEQWFMWPFTVDRTLFVKAACFVATNT